jgi:crotonobetainyl-CoA:carnitine CoA-transferase CaiB-like acyl-CoA transferase
MTQLPLTGLRVVSVEQYGAGPFGSLYLAHLGAEVIKIESPAGGDSSRASGPHFLGEHDSQFFQTFNQGKRSLTLDLKSEAGQEVLRRLAGSAQAVMNNLRGDQPSKLGLDYAALGPVRRDLVCLHLSGYGRTGPRAAWPAYDYLMQAEAGFMHLTGEPDGPPTRMGLSVVDYLSGITAAFALMASVWGAGRSGTGQDVDVALYDVAIHQLTYPATWYLNAGEETERRPRSGHPYVVPCELLPTADGHVFVMCVLPKFWEALARAMEVPELIDDPRFATPADRRANRDALAEALDARSRRATTDEWLERFAGRVPAAPVRTLPEALDNPYLEEVGGIGEVDHPALPGLRLLRSPIRLGGERLPMAPGPALGADSDAILGEIGYDAAARAALRAQGTVR